MPPQRILVFRIGSFGDTIVTLPAFWSIREAYPEANITLLTSKGIGSQKVGAKSVLPAEGLFDDWIGYSPKAGIAGLVSQLGLLGKIRAGRFDAVFYLMPRNRTPESIERDRRFFKLAGIRNLFGFDYLKSHHLDPNQPKPLPFVASEYDFYIDLLEKEGIARSERGPDFALTVDETRIGTEFLESEIDESDRGKPLVAVAPGTNWESKLWPAENYGEVLRKLVEEYSIVPVIFGGPEDVALGDRLIKECKTGINTAGKLDIRTGAAAMKSCALFLGNDTGSMHMASAVGLPCVAIFAATHFPGRWYPYGDGHTVFRHQVPCEGCNSPDCPEDFKCIRAISTKEVFEACARILGGS
ncbi:MAG: glycosyltransferase family 9 protein [Pyrinomonadaceae bacterium]